MLTAPRSCGVIAPFRWCAGKDEREMKTTNGTGTGWVQRWFAKPFDKGSIPSRASKLRTRLSGPPPLSGYWPRQWRYWLGLRLAWWAIDRSDGFRSFAAGLVYPLALAGAAERHDSPDAVRARDLAAATRKAEQERDKFKADAIEARKALSQLKRQHGSKGK